MKNLSPISNILRPQTREVINQDSVSVSDAPSWTVDLKCSVPADTQRIFSALTVPEYIEAWICVPGYHLECRNLTSSNANGFQIEHYCRSGKATKISGTYRSFLKRKLSFSWRPTRGSVARESFVDIRLQGAFERSILRLRHFGLDSEDDFNWHSAFWSSSIARLCKLFDRPAADLDERRQRAGK
jgi:uncharacterized protein YndB with AHSA1/START domain